MPCQNKRALSAESARLARSARSREAAKAACRVAWVLRRAARNDLCEVGGKEGWKGAGGSRHGSASSLPGTSDEAARQSRLPGFPVPKWPAPLHFRCQGLARPGRMWTRKEGGPPSTLVMEGAVRGLGGARASCLIQCYTYFEPQASSLKPQALACLFSLPTSM